MILVPGVFYTNNEKVGSLEDMLKNMNNNFLLAFNDAIGPVAVCIRHNGKYIWQGLPGYCYITSGYKFYETRSFSERKMGIKFDNFKLKKEINL